MDLVRDTGRTVARHVNSVFQNREPWQIVVITTTTVLGGVWLLDFFGQEEGE